MSAPTKNSVDFIFFQNNNFTFVSLEHRSLRTELQLLVAPHQQRSGQWIWQPLGSYQFPCLQHRPDHQGSADKHGRRLRTVLEALHPSVPNKMLFRYNKTQLCTENTLCNGCKWDLEDFCCCRTAKSIKHTERSHRS